MIFDCIKHLDQFDLIHSFHTDISISIIFFKENEWSTKYMYLIYQIFLKILCDLFINKESFNNEKNTLALKFDFLGAISQYRALHLKEVNIV